MKAERFDWNIKCVVYDCDGVLFDSLEANGRLYNDLSAGLGRGPLTEEQLKYVHSHTVFESIRCITGEDEGLEKKGLELLKETDLSTYIKYLKMEPNLLQALSALKERGTLRAVNTNRTTSMKYIMERYNLWPYFDMVVTALDVKNPKPHPESIEKIVSTLKLNKEEIVFIGDSQVDKQTAESAGVRFIAYKNKEISNGVLIHNHLELLELLRNEKGS
jgi:HAD superfamily hydrolase (TIGR01509 family)